MIFDTLSGRFGTPETAARPGENSGSARLPPHRRNLRAAVAGLSPLQLDTPYRPEGWTVRQVVHHLPDSHLNAYTRIKLALTEEEPTIKPYEEARWAELARCPNRADRAVAGAAGLPPPALAPAAAATQPGRLCAAVPASRARPHVRAGEVLALYAWHGQAPRRPHHLAAPANGVGLTGN